MAQPGVVRRIDGVDALGNQLAGHRFDVVARQHRAGLDSQTRGQFRGPAAEFQRHVVQRAIFLFGKDPNFALTIRFNHDALNS